MPYRVHLRHASEAALDRLVELGALDADAAPGGGLAAIMPDSVTPDTIAAALGMNDISVSPAIGRDAGSVWRLGPRAVQAGRLRIVPAGTAGEPRALRLIDSPVFGSGLHATTALCLEMLDEIVEHDPPDRVLDVGTGSGVLALAALHLGVPSATAIDLDEEALGVAEENARLNGVHDRLQLLRGGPDTLSGAWPLVLANVQAAPLIEMASVLVTRVGHHGRLVLSGIARSLEADVTSAYRRLGMRHTITTSRDGWIALALRASW